MKKRGRFGSVKGKACETPQQDNSSSALETALWRALSETMVLLRMCQSDASAPTVARWMEEHCFLPAFNPYKTIVDLEEKSCVQNVGARVDLDGRRRQFYRITETGKDVLEEMLHTVEHVSHHVQQIASALEGEEA